MMGTKRVRRRVARAWFAHGADVILCVVVLVFGACLLWALYELAYVLINGERA